MHDDRERDVALVADQPRVGGQGLPLPYCAVPVLAWVPGGSPVPAAVPSATTDAIICLRSSTARAGSGRAGALSSGDPATSRAGWSAPLSTEAATTAMESGETTIDPCPIADAARSAPSLGSGTLPGNDARPISAALPMP